MKISDEQRLSMEQIILKCATEIDKYSHHEMWPKDDQIEVKFDCLAKIMALVIASSQPNGRWKKCLSNLSKYAEEELAMIKHMMMMKDK